MKYVLRVVSILLSVIMILQFPSLANSTTIPSTLRFNILGSIGGLTTAVAISDNYVYVGKGSAVIVLERTEGGLTQKGIQINLPTMVTDLKIEGKMLYAAAGSSGLHIIDITDPLKPVETGVYKSSGLAEAIAVKGSTVYLADEIDGLQIIDVSNFAKPILLGQAYEGRCALGLAVYGSTVYVAAANDGLLVVDVSRSNAPKELNAFKTPGIARDVAVSGKYAYVADDWNGICIVDTLKDYRGVLFPRQNIQFALKNQYAYAACGQSGLSVINLKDPCNPFEAAHLDFANVVSFIRINGDYAYLFSEDCLYTVAISDPLHPVCQNEVLIRSDDAPQGVDMDSNRLYIVSGNILQIFSIKNPSEPLLMNAYILDASLETFKATEIDVRNGIAYIAMGYQGIYIYDVSDANKIKT